MREDTGHHCVCAGKREEGKGRKKRRRGKGEGERDQEGGRVLGKRGGREGEGA